ncbi:MAG: TrkH family potassium uptake protein [Pseudomonadota bacterium]
MTNIFEQSLIKFRKTHPAVLLLFSFLLAIGAGTCLLLTPYATVSGEISLIDALFTAASAVCVTGLTVVDTGTYFTLFGQWTILVLIQLGGLGIMTISVTIFHLIGKRVSFTQRKAMQETFAHTPREDIYQLLKLIFIFTGIAELCGIILLYIHWSREYPPVEALYMAVFHSVSAFCNAGFSLFKNSFMGYLDDPLLNWTICALIVFGGIGFPVVYDIYQQIFHRREKRFKLSVQTKTVLTTTIVLIISGMALFLFLESDNTLKLCSTSGSLQAALFQSITCRTAGFNTVDMANLGNATAALMILLMFIGASPGSCGGGIKTTTFAVLGAFTWSRLRSNIRVNMFKKSIPKESVSKSISIVFLAISVIAVIFFLVLLSQQGEAIDAATSNEFRVYLFEVVSAFSTVGLSMGATTEINSWGKALVILIMLIGRVGVLTFSYIIAGEELREGIEYAEENLMLG